jgi:hypothetical protein
MVAILVATKAIGPVVIQLTAYNCRIFPTQI